jgi:hypothetical protein
MSEDLLFDSKIIEREVVSKLANSDLKAYKIRLDRQEILANDQEELI